MLTLIIMWFATTARADFPENNYFAPATVRSGIGKAQFDEVLNAFEARFAHSFSRVGCRLELVRKWSDPTSNAYAERIGSICRVTMFGGMARNPYMTKSGFMAVTLHEAGHHLAGYPTYSGSVMSCEGQSDYFAGLYGTRSGNLSLSRVLAHLSGYRMPTRPGPKQQSVTRMECSHPEPQCRLNTMDAGKAWGPRPNCWYR